MRLEIERITTISRALLLRAFQNSRPAKPLPLPTPTLAPTHLLKAAPTRLSWQAHLDYLHNWFRCSCSFAELM